MGSVKKITVCSRSFSSNIVLRKELNDKYKIVRFNDDGLTLGGDNLIDYLQDTTHAITALEIIDEYVLSQLPELQVISKYGVGLDMIDLKAMLKHNVKLGWTGGINRRSVSELVIFFAIALLRHVSTCHKGVLADKWTQHIGRQLSGKTVGIIGCGFVGKDLVKLLQPFECSLIVNDIKNFGEFYKQYNIKAVELDELLRKSEIVTLHTPLDDSTRNMLTTERLSLMRSDGILINTARGGIIDEDALKKMLINGNLAGAAFDVFSIEPPEDEELLNLKNFIVTPHIGGSTNDAILAMGRAAISGLENNCDTSIFEVKDL